MKDIRVSYKTQIAKAVGSFFNSPEAAMPAGIFFEKKVSDTFLKGNDGQ